MGFFEPKWNSIICSRAVAAVKILTDQIEIARAAREAYYDDVRVEAVKKLTDQTILDEIVKSDKSARVRAAVCEKFGGHDFFLSKETNVVVASGSADIHFMGDKITETCKKCGNTGETYYEQY